MNIKKIDCLFFLLQFCYDKTNKGKRDNFSSGKKTFSLNTSLLFVKLKVTNVFLGLIFQTQCFFMFFQDSNKNKNFKTICNGLLLYWSTDETLRIFLSTLRSSHGYCSVRKNFLRNFAKFTGKNLCQSLF